MSLRPGDIIHNRYRIIKALGKGGFGAVYRAEDLSLKTICALKENLDYWDEAQRQFEREALILASLRHPGLPRVTDFFTIPAQGQYLVMDFVEGHDLQTIIDRVERTLAPRRVLTWIDQVCDALSYLHSQELPIIHRDVKPANIKITPSGSAMLVDFGIAKTFKAGSKTTMGARAVTPGYSPIEQYGHEMDVDYQPTDTRADIYALGATLYTLMTKQRPPESIARVTGAVLKPPSQLNPKVSPQMEQVILRAMAVLAEDRFPTVSEFRQALNQAAEMLTQGHSTAAITWPLLETSNSQWVTDPNRVVVPRAIVRRDRPISQRTAVGIEWVLIPEGEFIFGESQRKIYLPAYQIARYPVTNQQYRRFLLANRRHPEPIHWKDLEYPVGKARHPVVGLSLYDALAFCRWMECRLPTEEEWEKAARGGDGRTYPWGEAWKDGEYCNNWDAKIGGTTPVDRYPQGVSPYGVWDMVGNVWEWTASEYRGPHMQVLCGGSWRLFGGFNVRLTRRQGAVLNDSRDDLGFRCARIV